MDMNTPLGGSQPVDAAPVLRFSGILLTAVVATPVHTFTAVFMGTSTGHLKKAIIRSIVKASEYSSVVIDKASPVNANLVFDKAKNYLYVMTERKVTMVKVQECHVFQTCNDCLGANDPYCGWCPSVDKCSLKVECIEAVNGSLDLLSWLSYNASCPTITEVHPNAISRTSARVLNLAIEGLPSFEEQFLCVFTALGKTLITNAIHSEKNVNCTTPSTDSLPSNLAGKHHFTAKLSVIKKNGLDIAATNFTFYDCSTYTSCIQCVSSDFPCDWCVTGHRCTHDTGENCRNDVLVIGVSVIFDMSYEQSIRYGPGFCPQIKTYRGSTESLVASGFSKRITVKFYNVMKAMADTRILCQFSMEGHIKQVKARLIGDILYCEEMLFSYNTQAPNITVTFDVTWDDKPLDNPENIHVSIYKCSDMSHICGTCLKLPKKYSCGWCQENDGSCQVHEHCNHLPTSWLERNETCPNTFISPQNDIWAGDVNITMTGINFRDYFSDTSGGITVVHNDGKLIADCIPFPELYVNSTSIFCRMEGLHNLATDSVSRPITGSLEVKVLYELSQSKDPHSSVNPQILSFKPNKGPKSGGTALEIWGLHMDAGGRAEAFVGGLPCNITRRLFSQIVCITSASKDEIIETVKIKFGEDLSVFKNYKFHYVEDPEIISVESGPIYQRGVPRSIPSGGITVNVRGYNLNAVTTPYIYIVVDGKEYYNTCKVESPTEMKCQSPNVPPKKLTFLYDGAVPQPIALNYGFKMDNVARVQNLGDNPRFSKFMIYPDPIYYPFTEKDGIKHFKSDYLTINGLNLDRASQVTDVQVEIGTSFCLVTSLSRSQLTCRPPSEQPSAKEANGNPDEQQLPQVVVTVGNNLKYTIGKLSYALKPAVFL